MTTKTIAWRVLNNRLNIPTEFSQLLTKRNEVRRGNITIYVGCLKQASESEFLGSNNEQGEHYLANGVERGVPWYATARNPVARAA